MVVVVENLKRSRCAVGGGDEFGSEDSFDKFLSRSICAGEYCIFDGKFLDD